MEGRNQSQNPPSIFRCVNCNGPLIYVMSVYSCSECAHTYPIEEDIVVFEGQAGKNLRIGGNVFDIHRFRRHRMYFERRITSDVEFAARLHSVEFVDFHARLLAPHLTDAVVADVGCGQLPYGTAFATLDIKAYYAFDLDRVSLGIARDNICCPFPIYLVQNGVERLPLSSGSVDAVVSSEVIEHVDDPMGYLAEMWRICRPGGYLSISTPSAVMYLYPHRLLQLLRRPRSISQWWRELNPHTCWAEALAWHPGLRPSVFRSWLEQAGFEVVRHETRLWYYGTPIKPAWRFFEKMERIGLNSSGRLFDRYLKLTDRILASRLPLIRWAGIRQFALCRKPD